MAMIETAQKAPFGAITTYRAGTALLSVATTVKTWIQDRIDAHRTAAALEGLSPQMLEDIGMTVADVDAIRTRSLAL